MALPAVVVLALVAVVAIAATGSTPSGSGSTRPPAESLLDMFFTFGLVAVLAGGVLMVYGLAQRKAMARHMATGRRRSSLTGWVVLACAYGAIWYFRPDNLDFARPDRGVEAPPLPDPALPTGTTQDQSGTYEPAISWLSVALVVCLCIAGIGAYVVSRRRSRDRGPTDEWLAAELAHALDDTLDDLRAEADPRRAIIAAYARLERVLAANGVQRLPAETVQEYVPRVLRNLALDPMAIEHLTELYTRAKFSHHEVDSAMKEEAIAALEAIREELRLAAEERSRAARELELGRVGALS